MEDLHIINIGYHRSGTTWTWKTLCDNPWFTQVGPKENYDIVLGRKTVQQYLQDYSGHLITANFCPIMYSADQYIIWNLSQCPAVRVSIILRNPYDLHWSWHHHYNRQYAAKTFPSFNDYLKTVIQTPGLCAFDKILLRWQKFFKEDKFQIFFYEDLEQSPRAFFLDYCQRMQLPVPETIHQHKINYARYNPSVEKYIDPSIIGKINDHIDKLQPMVSRNISHWKSTS